MTPSRCVFLAILLAACSTADARRALNEPVIDTLPGNIIRVHNTGPMRWRDTSGWKLVLEKTISPEEGTPGQLNDPTGIVADNSGRIYVLDGKPAQIKVYDASGFVKAFGREGAGPGEFSSWGMITISRDTIVQHDPRQSRTSSYTRDGTFLKSWKSLCCWGMSLVADDSGRAPVPGNVRVDSVSKSFGAGAGYIRYHMDGTLVDTIVFPPQSDLSDKMWHTKQMAMSIPFQPARWGSLTRSGFYAWGLQNEYRIIISRTGLDTVRIIESQAPPVPIPDSVRQARLDRTLKNNEELKGIAKFEDMPTTYPTWTTFSTDADNNFWVARPGPQGDSSIWDVFDPSGNLLGSVPSPIKATYRMFWIKDRLVALDEDEGGTLALKIFRVEKGGDR